MMQELQNHKKWPIELTQRKTPPSDNTFPKVTLREVMAQSSCTSSFLSDLPCSCTVTVPSSISTAILD